MSSMKISVVRICRVDSEIVKKQPPGKTKIVTQSLRLKP